MKLNRRVHGASSKCHDSFSVWTLRKAVNKCVDLKLDVSLAPRCFLEGGKKARLGRAWGGCLDYFAMTILRIFATSSALTFGASLPQLLRT